MLSMAAAICVATSNPAAPYAGDPPALVTPKPVLPAYARSAAGFAPRGWVVEKSIEGDLNGDGRPDLVAILRGEDPDCVVHLPDRTEAMDTNPRMLLVAFGGKTAFELQVANAAVIPRIDDPYMDDPLELDAFSVRTGVIRLRLSYWRSMGGWTSYTSTLSFRWNGKRFRLIGFDRDTTQRNSGQTEVLSMNFITGRAKIVTGSMEDGIDDVTRWQQIPSQPQQFLDTIGDGLGYEPVLKSNH